MAVSADRSDHHQQKLRVALRGRSADSAARRQRSRAPPHGTAVMTASIGNLTGPVILVSSIAGFPGSRIGGTNVEYEPPQFS